MTDPHDAKRCMEAAFVTVRHPEIGYLYQGPMSIVLDVGDYVWIEATYSDEMPDGVVQVGDTRSKGYDVHGNRVLSVPAAWCRFLSADEAECMMRCMEEDERLLSYAR